MNLDALRHIIRSAQSLAENKIIIVLGSASLLAHFPELGDREKLLSATYDADILVDPFDELTSIMLDEALGEDRAYYRIHGYHADVLRDSVTETFPTGWRERLSPIKGMTHAFALDPHDLAAVKILVGRSKDLDLVTALKNASLIKPDIVLNRIESLPIQVEAMPRVLATYKNLFGF
jgi:hypothetical protein